jgi:hypothetical protein
MNAAPRLTLCLLRQGFGAAWKFPLNGFAALLNLFQKLAQSRLCGLLTLEIGNPSLSDDELVVCFAPSVFDDVRALLNVRTWHEFPVRRRSLERQILGVDRPARCHRGLVSCDP